MFFDLSFFHLCRISFSLAKFVVDFIFFLLLLFDFGFVKKGLFKRSKYLLFKLFLVFIVLIFMLISLYKTNFALDFAEVVLFLFLCSPNFLEKNKRFAINKSSRNGIIKLMVVTSAYLISLSKCVIHFINSSFLWLNFVSDTSFAVVLCVEFLLFVLSMLLIRKLTLIKLASVKLLVSNNSILFCSIFFFVCPFLFKSATKVGFEHSPVVARCLYSIVSFLFVFFLNFLCQLSKSKNICSTSSTFNKINCNMLPCFFLSDKCNQNLVDRKNYFKTRLKNWFGIASDIKGFDQLVIFFALFDILSKESEHVNVTNLIYLTARIVNKSVKTVYRNLDNIVKEIYNNEFTSDFGFPVVEEFLCHMIVNEVGLQSDFLIY